MSSTCFETEGLSSGTRLYVQVRCNLFQRIIITLHIMMHVELTVTVCTAVFLNTNPWFRNT